MSPQEAIVAVAKSLLAVIHAVLRSGQPYRERDAVLLERAGAAEAGSTPRTSVAPTGGGAGEVCRGCGTDAESGSERGCGTKPRRTERRRRNGCGATEAGLAEEFATRRPGELSNRKNRRSRSPFPAAAAKSAGASRDSGRGRLIRIRLSGRCPTAHPQQAPPTIAPPDRNGVREEKQCRTQDVILHLGNIFEANASLYSPGAHTTATSITRRVDSVFSRLLSRPHALHVTPSKDAPKPSC